MWENANDEVTDAAILVLSEELTEIVREKRRKRGRKCRNWIARRETLGASNPSIPCQWGFLSTLALLFRIPPCTISRFLPETLQSIDFQENIGPLKPSKFRLINIVSSCSTFFFLPLRTVRPIYRTGVPLDPPDFLYTFSNKYKYFVF